MEREKEKPTLSPAYLCGWI